MTDHCVDNSIDIRIDVKVYECVDQMSDNRSQCECSSGLAQSLAQSVTHNRICSQFPSINSTPALINVRQNERPNAYQSSNQYSMNEFDCNKRPTTSNVSKVRSKSAPLKRSDCIKQQKRSRHNFDDKQIDILEAIFENCTHYPDGHTIDRLAQQFGTPVNKIQIWFQNRRAKFKRIATHPYHPFH